MKKIKLKKYLKSKNAKIYYWCLSITLIWRSGLEVLNQIQGHLHKQPANFNPTSLAYLSRWAHWDGAWYQGIIQHGYTLSLQPGQQAIVFFPLFPMTTKYLSDITRLNPILTGLFLNIILTSVSAFFMYKLTLTVAEKYTKKVKNPRYMGTLGVLSLLLYPASLFLAAYYVEPFLILGIIGSIYFALKGRLWWAAVFMVIATASKSSGVVLLPTDAIIIYEQWRSSGKRVYSELAKKVSILFVGLAGIGSFMLYQLIKFNNALLWYKDQTAWRPKTKNHFWSNIYQVFYAHIFHRSYFGGNYYYALYLFIMALPFAIIGLGIWIAYKYKTYWPLVLGFFSLALPISTGTLLSLDRIEIVTIPMVVFVVVACMKKKSYTIGLISVLIASSVLLALFTLGFLRVLFAG